MKRLLKHPKVRKHLRQGLKFCIAGGVGAAIEFSIISLLVKVYGVEAHIAYIPSGLTTLVFVFFFNKYITFGDRDGSRSGSQTMRFAIVYGMAFVINYTLASGLNLLGEKYVPASEYVIALGAKAIAIGVTAFWNYFFSSAFIFKKPVEAEFAVSAAV